MNQLKLIDLMKSKGYSFKDLADASGAARSTIERVAYGQAKMPYPKTKRLIAQVFGVEIDFIDEFKGPAPEPPPLPEPAPEPVKLKFAGEVKDRAWDVSRELGFTTISPVKNLMLKNPELMALPYEELRKAVAAKFKKEVKE